MNISEVKKQVENAPNVKATEFGKMGKEKLETVLFKDTFAENVTTDLVNRQFYQPN